MQFTAIFEKGLAERIKKLAKKDAALYERLISKIEEILEKPQHYKPLQNILKGNRRVHVGSFVLLFEVDEKKNEVIFLKFEHHDDVY